MKSLPHIAAQLFCQPWSILPQVHENLCSQFRLHVEQGGADPPDRRRIPSSGVCRGAADDPAGPMWQDQNGQIGYYHSQVQALGRLAILPIKGSLGRNLSSIAMLCGCSDYDVISRQARNIALDPAITTVVVDIDSPGGMCLGALECATALLEMSQAGKMVVAYTSGMACSNGYFMAAACDEIWAGPSAMVGSISTFCAYLDQSRSYEQQGLAVQVFRSGDLKNAGFPGKPWSQEEKDDQQRVVDQFSQQFKGFVTARRALGPEVMRGQYWPALSAPTGLVDGLADDLDSLLAMLL